MTDTELIATLERGEAPAGFGHAAHVRAGYLYVRELGFGPAIGRMEQALRLIGGARYHATITVAFLALIAERLERAGDPGNWPAFAAAHPDLLDPSLLHHYYRALTLGDPLARQVLLLEPIRPVGQLGDARG